MTVKLCWVVIDVDGDGYGKLSIGGGAGLG